jgi:DNA repair exonuclease SbcCD ATPase subunit
MRMAAKAEEEGKPDSSPEAMKAAAESMKLAEKELEQVAQSAKDLKELEKGLAVLQQAKKLNAEEGLDGKKCEGCQSMADYEAMFAKLMKDKGNPDEGGFGDGGQRDEKDSANSKFKTEISKSQVTKGKVLLSLKTKGMGEHVDFKEQYKAAVHDIKQGVSEAIQQEEIPPGYHDGIKSYFESLDEKPQSGK